MSEELACVAGARRGRERGFGAREKREEAREEGGRERGRETPSRVIPRPNSLHLPFRTPSMQATEERKGATLGVRFSEVSLL